MSSPDSDRERGSVSPRGGMDSKENSPRSPRSPRSPLPESDDMRDDRGRRDRDDRDDDRDRRDRRDRRERERDDDRDDRDDRDDDRDDRDRRDRDDRDDRDDRRRSYSSRDRSIPHRLFIGNLPKGSDAPTERDIENLFDKYGSITHTSVKEGFAFVEFENEDDMHKAMEGENGTTFRRFQIRVQLSHASRGEPRERRQPGQGKCFNCQGFGHWARECTEPRAERDSYRRDDRDRRDDRRSYNRDSYRDDRRSYRDDRRDYRDDRRRDRRDSYDRRDYNNYSGYGYREPGPSRRGRDDRSPRRSSPRASPV